MKVYFTNAKIMTMECGTKIFDGELITENDRILYCGEKLPEGDEKAGGADRKIDCKGNLLMPGFKNAHAHSAMTFVRNITDDKPLDRWLNEDIFPREAKLTEDAVYAFSKIAFLEYLTSGITACFDMYMFFEGISAAADEYGFRTVLCDSINKFGGTAKSVEECYKKYNGKSPMYSYIPGFHAEYTTSYEMMKDLGDLARELKTPVYAHVSETKAEVEGCKERYNMTPPELIESLGMYDYGGGGFHCVYFTDNDMRIFKERNLYSVTNPGSNLKLASGIADIQKQKDMGIHVAIGTDGPASNNCLDFFKEMSLVTNLQKVKTGDPTVISADYVLDCATVQGAHAMGLHDCDTIAAGKMADIIMIDLHQPNMQPIFNITSSIVHSGCKNNIKMTMIGGKILYMDGEFFTGEDPEEVYARAVDQLKGIV